MKRNIVRAVLALPLAGLVLTPGPASVAAPGDLDPAFGSGGVVVVDDGTEEWASAAVVQPDGKVVLVGQTLVGGSQDALVVRLNPDGTRDPDFGYRRVSGPPGQHSDDARAVALQPDGKIVMAGRTTKNQDAVVWRLLPNGPLDPSFGGGDGLVTIDSGGFEFLNDVAVAPDGSVVVTGMSSRTNKREAVVYRLTPAGEMDSTFDTDGALGLGNDGSTGYGLAVQPDGKILVTGDFVPSYGMVVRRLTVSGAPDLSFSGDGESSMGVGGNGRDLVVQPDGKIVVAGYVYFSEDDDAALVRYSPNGDLDTSFGSPTGVQFDAGGHEGLSSVALTPGGGVVASGASDAGDEAIVVGTSANGEPLPGFGTAGLVSLPGTIVEGEGIAAAPDGRVVVVGGDEKYRSSAVVYRLLGGYQSPQPQPAVQKCQGKVASIVGTPGKDRITGTKKADVIVALGGNDVVDGLGGNDVVCAGDGDDTVKGGPGKDDLRGERGKDRLIGGAGRDKLVGGPQQDTVTQ